MQSLRKHIFPGISPNLQIFKVWIFGFLELVCFLSSIFGNFGVLNCWIVGTLDCWILVTFMFWIFEFLGLCFLDVLMIGSLVYNVGLAFGTDRVWGSSV